jgi:hypothetical protein
MLHFVELKSLSLACGVTVRQGDNLVGCAGGRYYVVLVQRVDDDDTQDHEILVFIRGLTNNRLRVVNEALLNVEFEEGEFRIA